MARRVEEKNGSDLSDSYRHGTKLCFSLAFGRAREMEPFWVGIAVAAVTVLVARSLAEQRRKIKLQAVGEKVFLCLQKVGALSNNAQ